MKTIISFLTFILFVFALSANAQYSTLNANIGFESFKKVKADSKIEDGSKIFSLDKINNNPEIENSLIQKNVLSGNRENSPKKFSFSILPYAWFMSVGGTVGYYEGQKFGFNKSFSDAVKYLKMAAAVAGKFKYERVSFVYDISYINLKGFGTEIPANTPQVLSSNWTVKQAMYDLFLAYLIPSKSKNIMVDIYAGGRLWNVDVESTILDTIGNQKMSQYTNSWFDPVLGVNAEYVLSKDNKWAAWTKGDIGGFGVNSQMTWQLNAGFAYMLSKNVPLFLGFKYVGVNYDNDSRAWQVNEYGPTLGFGYRY